MLASTLPAPALGMVSGYVGTWACKARAQEQTGCGGPAVLQGAATSELPPTATPGGTPSPVGEVSAEPAETIASLGRRLL